MLKLKRDSGRCALCSASAKLQQSHLIPRFVSDWMKRTGTGYIRLAHEPNVRQQDGVKVELLCADCEQRFARWERWFADNIFRPYIDERRAEYVYGLELYHFLLSLLWRALRVTLDREDGGLLHRHHRPAAEQVEARWRSILLGEADPSPDDEVHLFLTDIGTEDGVTPVEGWSSYVARASDLDVGTSQDMAVVYVKFARFIALGAITPFDESTMVRTKIDPEGGTLVGPQGLHDPVIGEYIADRARQSTEVYRAGLSANQRKKITAKVRSDMDRFKRSDLGKAIWSDHVADVKPPEIAERKIGRNEKCPCGSGKKYKRCHGRGR